MNTFKIIVENYLDAEETDLSECTNMQGEVIDEEELKSCLNLKGEDVGASRPNKEKVTKTKQRAAR